MTHPIKIRPRRRSAAYVAERVASVEPLTAGRQVDAGQWVGDGLRQAHLNPAEGVHDAAETCEPDLDVVVEGDTGVQLNGLRQEGRATLGESGVDLVRSVARDVDVGVARDGHQCRRLS